MPPAVARSSCRQLQHGWLLATPAPAHLRQEPLVCPAECVVLAAAAQTTHRMTLMRMRPLLEMEVQLAPGLPATAPALEAAMAATLQPGRTWAPAMAPLAARPPPTTPHLGRHPLAQAQGQRQGRMVHLQPTAAVALGPQGALTMAVAAAAAIAKGLDSRVQARGILVEVGPLHLVAVVMTECPLPHRPHQQLLLLRLRATVSCRMGHTFHWRTINSGWRLVGAAAVCLSGYISHDMLVVVPSGHQVH